LTSINAMDVKKFFLASAHALNDNKDWINELNVFPVPDGDTGTNMTMTILSSAKEVLMQKDDTMASIATAISSGALKGARGNSGVILSQLFRGFFKVAKEEENLTIPVLTKAFNKAVDSAYNAVMKPKEGTILTVAKAISESANNHADEQDMGLFLQTVIADGDDALAHTPDLLPVLKQAGVVDSGGQGLMVILHGILDAFNGKEVDMTLPMMNTNSAEKQVDVSNLETSDIRFGYCTEFIIKLKKTFTEDDERNFKAFLTSIGDSIVCVADEDIVKIHVHTNDPGLAITRALTYGELSRMKIDNMREEHEERLFKNAEAMAEAQKKEAAAKMPKKAFGFVQVASGEGFDQIFKEMGVDAVISGGQTMNPSTEDILTAIQNINADVTFVMPNNGNIVMSARQAASIMTDREVIVIPTGTITEGISAMLGFNEELSKEENEEAMKEMAEAVSTIEITYAVRDTNMSGKEIKKDDYMAICGKEIVANGTDLTEVLRNSIQETLTDESSLVTLYYGQETTEEEAEAMAELLESYFPDVEFSVIYGGQPVYYYFISVE